MWQHQIGGSGLVHDELVGLASRALWASFPRRPKPDRSHAHPAAGLKVEKDCSVPPPSCCPWPSLCVLLFLFGASLALTYLLGTRANQVGRHPVY